MEKVKIGYIGKKPTRWAHGNIVLEFQPGEIKEVEANIAEVLLTSTTIQRDFSKKPASQERVCLFAEVINEDPLPVPANKPKRANKPKQPKTPIIPVAAQEPEAKTEGSNDADNSNQGEV